MLDTHLARAADILCDMFFHSRFDDADVETERGVILEEIGMSIEDLEENALALGEEIDVLSDDLADVESVVFDEDEDDGDYFEVECPNCEEPILIDDEARAAGEVQCPNCETRFALDLSDDTVDADEDAE